MTQDGFFCRLRNRVREANLNSESFTADAADLAGRAAERQVSMDLSERLAGTGWEFRDNVRVPDPTQRRHRELDFVITSPEEVIVVELKNWSGRIELGTDGSVIQHRRFDNGEQNHGALFADLAERVEVLHLYHRSKEREAVKIRGYVIFFNDNLEVPESLTKREDVLTYATLLNFMPPADKEPSLLRRILLAIMKLFGAKLKPGYTREPSIPSTSIKAFRETVAELGGWDVIDLYGGGYVIGDIQASTTPGFELLNRMDTRSLKLDVDRSVVLALFSEPTASVQITNWDGTISSRSVRTSLPIKVRPAGSKDIKEYQVRNIVRLSFGYKRRPCFRYTYDELFEGMLIVGKVCGSKDIGVFVDIGLSGKDGRPRDVFAPAERRDTAKRVLPLGSRVLVRIKMIARATERVFVQIIEPQPA